MRRSPSRTLPVFLALLLLTAGCLSGGPSETPSPTETPTDTASPGTPTSTSTPDGLLTSTNQPDPDKEVRLENLWNRSVELRVRVVRKATNETVHDGTYVLAPDTERTVYNVSEANPDGIEAFTVVVTGRNATERVTIETSACYGNAYAEVREDGTLYLYYAIC